MRAGKLDRQIVLQGLTNTVDAYGTPVETWATFATLRAQIVQQGTDEFLRAGGAVPETAIVFRARFVAGVTTSHRVSYGGAIFNLKEVKELGRREGLELRCTSQGTA